ncbi:MAG: hypothetical protein ACREJO_04795 [Phycisphaerales bacterium]
MSVAKLPKKLRDAMSGAVVAGPLSEVASNLDDPQELLTSSKNQSQKTAPPKVIKFFNSLQAAAVDAEAVEVSLCTKTSHNATTVSGEWHIRLGDAGSDPAVTEVIRELVNAQRVLRQSEAAAAPLDFLERAARLHESGFPDTAVDLVFDAIDAFLKAGQYALLNSVLLQSAQPQYPSNVLLALLVTTRVARDKLVVWKDFAEQAIPLLESRPDFDARAVRHLRGRGR